MSYLRRTCQRPLGHNQWRRLRPVLEHLEDRTVPSGGLDLSFSGDGKLTTDLYNRNDHAHAVVVQPDGKIVTVGYSTDAASNTDIAVARYNVNGTLDTSFGSGDGHTMLTFGVDDYAYGVALQSDGKIIIAGSTDAGGDQNFVVVRMLTTGGLDTSFDGDGWKAIDFGGFDQANGVVIQPNGKIVVGGYSDSGSADFAVARLNVNGSLDTTFSDDGKYQKTFGAEDIAEAVALQQDGKIVLAGYTDVGSAENNFAVARINANGTSDSSFDADGNVIIDFGDDDRATGVTIQPDGKIVVGGYGAQSSDDFAVARLNANGSLDATFNATSMPTISNGNGKLSFSFGGTDRAKGIALQPGGKIVLAGYTVSGAAENFAIARVNPNGTEDRSFDANGEVVVDFGGVERAEAVALQADGKVVVVGRTDQGSGGPDNFAVARLIGANVQFAAVGGAPGRVQVFKRDGTSLGAFFPYAASDYDQGVAVALGDVNSDGIDDLITAATIGNPHTKVYNGNTFESGTFFTNPESHLIAEGFPYAINFNVGVNVAAGDVNGDGYADVITGAVPGNPHVRVFDGKEINTSHNIPTETNDSVLTEGFAYGVNFNIGANVAAGDVNGDGLADVVTGPSAGNPHTKVFNAASILATRVIPTESSLSLLTEFFPYALNFNVGAFVSVGDYNRDGYADVITGASIGNPEVRVFDGRDVANETFDLTASLMDFYFAFEVGENIGISVAAADFTNDGRADVFVGSRSGTPEYGIFRSNFPDPATLLFSATNHSFSGPLYVAA